MMNPQLHPLEINSTTGEPFLRLRNHKNIIITPPRPDDAPSRVSILNDFSISDCLSGPPYPYTYDDAKSFLDRILEASTGVLKELEDAKDEQELITVGRCPVQSLRELKEDGSDIFIGDISLVRCMHGELMGPAGPDGVDWDNKVSREESNNQIPNGDPQIIWSFGDYLAPSHHRQGIMSDAVDTVLHEWAIPRMKVRHMWVSAFTGNEGSVKVFLKNGFKLIKTHEDFFEVKGKRRGLHLMEWRYNAK